MELFTWRQIEGMYSGKLKWISRFCGIDEFSAPDLSSAVCCSPLASGWTTDVSESVVDSCTTVEAVEGRLELSDLEEGVGGSESSCAFLSFERAAGKAMCSLKWGTLRAVW